MIRPVIPDDGQKTGKREAAWRLFYWSVGLAFSATGMEVWLGVPLDGLHQLALATFGLATAVMLGAYGIAAAKQAGIVGK